LMRSNSSPNCPARWLTRTMLQGSASVSTDSPEAG
jgi:hypothetical protein